MPLLYRLWILLCHRWWTNCWPFLHASIPWSPSRLSPCPRSHGHPAFLVRFSVSRRRWTSWWKPQLSCFSSVSSSKPLTFGLAKKVVLETDVFQVFSQHRVLLRLPSRSLTSQFLAGFFCGGLQGLHPGQSSTAPDANQNVDFPVPRSGLQGFSSDQGPALFSTVPPGDAFQGFSHRKKSAEVTRPVRAGVAADTSSSTLGAHQMPLVRDLDEASVRRMLLLDLRSTAGRSLTPSGRIGSTGGAFVLLERPVGWWWTPL